MRTEKTRPLRVANRPWVFSVGAAACFLCGVLPIVAPLPIVSRLVLLVVFVGLSVPVALLARRRWTTLEIADRIRWKRPRLELDLDLAAARRVVIRRPGWHLREPTDYLLEVDAEGRTARLLFKEHWLFGGPAQGEARRIARMLDVELYDDAELTLKRWPRSPLHRLLYTGHEWAAYLLIATAVVGLGMLYNWLGP